jgi:hypothetical protein
MFVIDCVAFPGLKSEISTPRTKTRPRGPRTWGSQSISNKKQGVEWTWIE